jgi:cellulase
MALLAQSVFAHTYLSAVYLDNKLLSEGDCVRPHPSTAFDSPIPLVTQADMTCGWLPQAAVAANRKCPISAGSTIGIQWHHNSNSASDDIIDSTHKGPVMVYLAKSNDGAGSVWFKIYEDGFANGAWGVDRLLANKGRVDVTIPSDLPSGNYLLRGEIIALHGSYVVNGAQPYVGCVELTISGSGSASPATVALPGAYSPTDPGILLSIYQGLTSYVIPGPAVYKSGSSSSGSSSSGSSSGNTATAAPTNRPSTAPTTRPTNPTTAPTTAPVTPTENPNSGGNGGSLKVQVNSGSNTWWFAVDVSGGSESTVKVELSDSGSVSSFYPLSKASYGYFFSQSVQLQLPISLRFTSASGKQVVLQNYFNSFTDSAVKDTGKDYSSSVTPAPTTRPTPTPTTRATAAPTTAPTRSATPAPTNKPATQAPTNRPATQAPTSPASGQTVKLTQHSGSSAWWFAVAVSGIDAANIGAVEIKDSDSVSSYSCLQSSDWGYYIFTTAGKPLVAPFSIRVTSNSGATATATFNNFNGGSVADTKSSL